MIDLDHITDRVEVALRGIDKTAQVAMVRPDGILALLSRPVRVKPDSEMARALGERVELATYCGVETARAWNGKLVVKAKK